MNTPHAGATIVLAAGGTGGHVFPAQALAAELEARSHRLVLITDRRGTKYGGALERTEQHYIHAGSPVARGPIARGLGAINLLVGLREARRLLRRLSPAVSIGFGGYPSVPTMVAAARLRVPCAIHEQNAVLGRANRLLAPKMWSIATSFEQTSAIAPTDANKVVYTGNPVRADIAALAETDYPAYEPGGPFRLLITGGSQGARVLAEVVPEALARLPDELKACLTVAQQCRPETIDAVRRSYDAAGIRADLATFFDDVPVRLGEAHLVIARAGASTVAELAAAGRPGILIPLPYATDDHQTANARALESVGGAVLMPESSFTPASLAERVAMLMRSPDSLKRAGQAARALGRPHAAKALADLVDRLIPANGGRSAARKEAA